MPSLKVYKEAQLPARAHSGEEERIGGGRGERRVGGSVKGSTPPIVEWGVEGGREDDDVRGTKRERDSKEVFSCTMHNEERQTAHKGPTNEARVIHIHPWVDIRATRRAHKHAGTRGA